MNRFMFGRGWVYQDEAGDGTQGGAGGSGATAEGEAGDAGAAGGDDAGAVGDAGAASQGVDSDAGAKKPAAGEPKDMLDAITKGLEKTAPKVDDDPDGKKAAGAAAAAAEKHANGAPKKDAQGNELDDKGQVTKKAEAPKAKTAAELDLKPEERKVLGTKAQARFSEVITTLKSREAEIATLTEQMKPLAEARDTVLGIMEETGTSSDQLAAYLEFNRLLQSTQPKDLESALKMVEDQRAALYTALGREPADGGIDLLAEFPDLKQQVEESQITREAALELAAGRRERAANAQKTEQQRTQQQTVEQRKQAGDNALKDITAWTVDLQKKDIDFKAKEDKLLEQIDEVIKNYPANQWLATLKLLYSGITVQKTPPPANKGNTPIRPSGAKPGAKAPQNMYEAMWGGKAE